MDCLKKGWPEPIVPVQSLSDSGATAIPDRYVKPPSQRPSPSADTHSLHIPVIDLGGPEAETMSLVSDACLDWGFFQVVNHGVRPELMERAMKVWREFFHLPMEEKRKYANSPKTYEGYGSRLGVEKGAILDWGDYFFLHILPESLKDHDKWPALPASCRETVEEYAVEVMKLCRTLLKLVSESLGLEVGYLQEAFGGDNVGVCLRVNFYPKCPQPDLTLGLSSHSDPGGITILLADPCIVGLQVRKVDGWVTVHPVRDAFIVNIGDQVQVLSNAIYKSVEHRVLVNSAAERLSLAFFYNPRHDIPIKPAAQLTTPERPALYSAMTFAEYRLYIWKKGLHGKSQVKSMKAT